LGAIAVAISSGTAVAATLEFDFDQVTLNNSTHINSGGVDGGATGSSANIQSYMNSVLSSVGGSVTVTGAIANKGYTGDNNVVQSGGVYKTLANFNDVTGTFQSGLNHTFIMNNNFGLYGGTKYDSFSLTFSGVTLSQVKFDWEIFPDGSCTAKTTTACGGAGMPNLPTLGVYAGNTLIHTYSYIDALADFSAGSSTVAPQAVGGFDAWNLPAGTITLKFMDWPSEVAVRGFEVTTCCDRQAPEPGALSLLGLSLAGVSLVGLRRRLNS
jgi:hypothetical protein